MSESERDDSWVETSGEAMGWIWKVDWKVSGVLEARVGQQRPLTFDLDLDKAPRAVPGKTR